MSNWRESYRKGEWHLIDWMNLPPDEQRELVEALRRDVPMVSDENGMERRDRHMLPTDEVARTKHRFWKRASEILALGELEAAVEGDPPDDIEIWSEIRTAAEKLLAAMSLQPEVTEGSQSLSRQQHANDAVKHFHSIDVTWRLLRSQLDDDDERSLLDEAISSAAWNAFLAGRHFQAASNKAFEKHAVRGAKVHKGARSGAESTNRTLAALWKKRLSLMKVLVPKRGVAVAAAECERAGLGSRGAVRRQWFRHLKKTGDTGGRCHSVNRSDPGRTIQPTD